MAHLSFLIHGPDEDDPVVPVPGIEMTHHHSSHLNLDPHLINIDQLNDASNEGEPWEHSLEFLTDADRELEGFGLGDAERGVTEWRAEQGGISPGSHDSASDQVLSERPENSPFIQDSDCTDNSSPIRGGLADMVCYGMVSSTDPFSNKPLKIHDSHVKLAGDMENLRAKVAPLASNSAWPGVSTAGTTQVFLLEYREQKQRDHIMLSLPDHTEVGHLRENMTKPLGQLLKNSAFLVEAVSPRERLLDKINRAGRSADALVQVDINIYGPKDRAEEVGRELSAAKLWLQRPDRFRSEVEYENPHEIRFPGFEAQVQDVLIQSDAAAPKPRDKEERLQQMLSEVHNSLHRADELTTVAGDRRLITKLLEHQQRALAFMRQRESGTTDEKYRLWKKTTHEGEELYMHRITRTRSRTQPPEKGGGILADEMGMGKSLSILALVLESLERGRLWVDAKLGEEQSSTNVRTYTHSTLILVPSALLINNWLNEVRIHAGETLSVLKYHGPGRERDLNKLRTSDIVISTYNTLSTEFTSKRSLLHSVCWYRVVLDEAHIIRRPSTVFHRSCADLIADSRWCLTGTPIQNKLEDIGSLLMFLRAEPFHSLAQFRRFISVPFDQGESVAKDRLILLYDSLCLRRTKDILSLPGCEYRLRKLALAPAERDQYIKTENIIRRAMRQQVGEFETESRFGLFQAHLQLRIFCNHGTFQQQLSWKTYKLGLEAKEAWVGELGSNAEVTCNLCSQPRPFVGSNRMYTKFVENCHHILCLECLDDTALEQSDSGIPRRCPLCPRLGLALEAGPGPQPQVDDEGDVDMTRDEEAPASKANYFNKDGYSTKMRALIEDVKTELQARNTKSIIFSCWTRSLDLVGRHLKQENIEYLRIDGECLLSQRQRLLDRFARSSKVRVLIMTTGTGAFGLNLTAANRVFIVEPQWNPSVENQAIARAIRLRQQDIVIVTRYILLETVEEQMKSQQIKKRRIAAVGFAHDATAGEET